MTELLSDEEDQDAIEQNPNKHYIENQLQLLSIRAQSKKITGLETRQARLEKRSKVIQNQLAFDKKSTALEVRRLIQDGYLDRIDKHQSRAASPPASDSGCESQSSTEGWLVSVPSSPVIQCALPNNESAADAIMIEAGLNLPGISEDIEEILPPSMFEEMESHPISQASPTVQPIQGVTIFPYPLPKVSQNISPVKLLQTYLKRADKQATEQFDDIERTLTLRFSSAKVLRRKVIVNESAYKFPDSDTARNFLSMKALFSVPELASEKAGARFSGPFRSAWKLLEDENDLFEKALVDQKVQNVRAIQLERASHHAHVDAVVCEVPDPTLQTEMSHARTSTREHTQHAVHQIWDRLRSSDAYSTIFAYRSTLPIAIFRDSLLNSIHDNQVTILCGETGCGKSTQLPTFILEDALSRMQYCKIYVTEPRRISAISLAMRVSAELGESRKAISSGDSLLGFSIRLDSQISEKSRLIYATTGIVLRMLEENSDLGGITHLIIDEVHERSIESDFLLIVVKRLLRTRRDLRIVLMSATLQSDRFNDYFGGHCCIFNVPGRTFPVDQFFLEDVIERSDYTCDETSFYAKRGNATDFNNAWEIPEDIEDDSASNEGDLITYSERTVRAMKLLDPYKVNYDLICKLLDHLETELDRSLTQAILIFLPGMGEIRRLLDTLQAHKTFGDYRKWIIYPLHSSIPNDRQQAAFDVPPRGIRKIVIATNIAETGITIPDITCVIDGGKHKESRFDARRQVNKLVETFIAKSNARQRMGRAGRVQAGVCFHLFSRARYEKMAEHQLPEFQRLNLDDLALRVKTVRMGGIEEVLLEALDAPTPENVKRSINNLIEVGALNNHQDLTPLGRHLAKLPVDITLGKLILFGVRYSCLDPCLVIAASLSSKSPFETPMGREREASSAKQIFVRGESDFLTMWTAYLKWRTVCQEKPQHEHKFCRDSFLSMKNLGAIEELRIQYLKILVDSGLLQINDQDRRRLMRARFGSSRDGFVTLPSDLSANDAIPTFVEACLASAFYPNLINVEDSFRTVSKGQTVTIHPSSINHHNQNFSKRWITFYGLLKTKVATNAHDTGLVDDYIVALFCGSHLEVKPFSGTIGIDHNRIKFMTRDLRTLTAIMLLRDNLERQFAAFLDRKPVKDEWLEILQEVVQAFEAVAKQKLK